MSENSADHPKHDEAATATIVVTHNRIEDLRQSLPIVTSRIHMPKWLIIVSSGNDPKIKGLAKQVTVQQSSENGSAPEIYYLGSKTDLGGVGGFAPGMLIALSLSVEWIQCVDNDGHPEDSYVLKTLHSCARHRQLDAISPAVYDIKAPNKLTFPLHRGLVWCRHREELFESDISPKLSAVRDSEGRGWSTSFAVQKAAIGLELPSDLEIIDSNHDLLSGIASPFNGALFSARSLEQLGVPDYRLFIRDDEIESHRRLVRSGLRFDTCLTTAYLHPSGSGEFVSVLDGKMHTQYPTNDFKRYFTYRNRGYLMSQPGMCKLMPQGFLRFGWFFLIQRRDVRGFYRQLELLKQGRAENFERFDPKSK